MDGYPAAFCGPVCADSVDSFHTAECGTLNGQIGSHPEMLYALEPSVHTHKGRERERQRKEFGHFTSIIPNRLHILQQPESNYSIL